MKPKDRDPQEPDGLFKTPLERFIDPSHPLVRLAGEIDWAALDARAGAAFAGTGRPGTPSRFMIAMFILKATYDLSDEALFERWVYDPYFQHFTGEIYFQHEVPHERSGMTHWRGRLGPGFLDALIQESLRIAHKAGVLKGRHLEQVSVDSEADKKTGVGPRFPAEPCSRRTSSSRPTPIFFIRRLCNWGRRRARPASGCASLMCGSQSARRSWRSVMRTPGSTNAIGAGSASSKPAWAA